MDTRRTRTEILQDESRRATELLRDKVVSRIMRHRPTEVGIEFTDGTRLFVDSAIEGVELSITDGMPRPPGTRPESASRPKFTRLQGRYLKFIQEYLQLRGVAPAERDLQSHFRVTPPTVHQMILALERKGLIERAPGQARSIRVLVDPHEFSDEGPKLPLDDEAEAQ